jgi:hypothetical protein
MQIEVIGAVAVLCGLIGWFVGLACVGPEPARAPRPTLTPALATIPEGS